MRRSAPDAGVRAEIRPIIGGPGPFSRLSSRIRSFRERRNAARRGHFTGVRGEAGTPTRKLRDQED